MIIVRCIAWLRARLRLLVIVSYFVLALLIFIDIGIPRHHPHFLGDMIPGFWAGFGFLACILIIVFSKWLGKKFLFRPEDYYLSNQQGGDNG